MAETSTTTASSPTTNYLLVGSYLTIVSLWFISQVIYVPFVPHLLIMVTCILYAACHQSLILLQEDDGSTTEDTAGTSQHSTGSSSMASTERETLKASDAYQFPILGSISLFSLYLAFKFLDKDLVNLLIGAYFCAVGCIAMTMTSSPLVAKVLAPTDKSPSSTASFWTQEIVWKLPMEIVLEFNGSDIVALMGSSIICGLYFYWEKPWYLNNILGIVFCLQGIERFSLGTYKIGAILLIGLFFYDIFWVFGTDVMVTVAKNLDGPIKILFPRDGLEVNPETGKLECSLLGLGDIVIPGFFLALLLRFDAHRTGVFGGCGGMVAKGQQQPPPSKIVVDVHADFEKPYFTSGLISYVIGLATTLFVMFYFEAAQPALLYLVPACLGSSFLCALQRGELQALLDYSEEVEEEEELTTSDDNKKKEPQAKKDD